MDPLKQNGNDDHTLVNKVAEILRNKILKGNFKEGEKLVQDEWGEKLNVSRTPIREALKQLEMEGLVKLIPRKGAIVTPITKDDIEEMYYMRSIIEGIVVERSLPFLTDEDKEQLGQLLHEMENLQISEATYNHYIALNNSFHELLRKGNPWKKANKIIDHLGISPIAPKLLAEFYSETQLEHRRIYEAVMRNDPIELRVAMQYHILRTKNNLIGVIEEMNRS